ncbi:MAG: hypothetical protein IT462_00055 [Planctomycetes bacterium]|nr:hypothetical protein [Planctomycetota bacterium]
MAKRMLIGSVPLLAFLGLAIWGMVQLFKPLEVKGRLPDHMIIWAMLFCGMSVVLGIGGFTWFVLAGTMAAWKNFARRRGLRFKAGWFFTGPVISGEVDNVYLEMTTVNRGGPRRAKTNTTLHVVLPGAVPGDLTLMPTGSIGGATQDIRTGDAQLDHYLVIQSRDVPRARKILSYPPLRSALLDTLGRVSTFSLVNREISLECGGFLDAGQLEDRVGTVLTLAHFLVDASKA